MLASRLRLILIEVALKKAFFPSLNSFDEDQENSVREKDVMGTYQNRNSMKTVFKRSWWTRQKLCIILGNRRACHPQPFWRPSLLYLSALDYLQDLFKSSSSVLIPSFYSDRHMHRAQIFLHENLIEELFYLSWQRKQTWQIIYAEFNLVSCTQLLAPDWSVLASNSINKLIAQ